MKNYFLLLIFAILTFTMCSNNTEPKYSIDSDKLTNAFINYDVETVKTELDNLIFDLKPKVTKEDSFGHKKNLDVLIERINSNCSNITASLACYACIKTNPPQSEIKFSLDSLETKIKRILDVITSSDKILILKDVH